MFNILKGQQPHKLSSSADRNVENIFKKVLSFAFLGGRERKTGVSDVGGGLEGMTR